MNKIFKMDLHRMLHSVSFYVAIIFLIAMAVGQILGGMSTTLDGLMGAVKTGDAGADFMTTAMGAGVIYILLSIILSIFVCGDYSNGFAKNIFAVHADPKDYVCGKMLSMGVVSAFLLVLYTVISVIALPMLGCSVTLSGGIFGLIVFLVEKWLVSLALCAVVLFVALFTRNMAWSMFAGFVIATGGLSMGASLFAQMVHMEWIESIFSVLISSASKACTMSFSPLVFLRVLIISAVWIALTYIASTRTLKKKDI